MSLSLSVGLHLCSFSFMLQQVYKERNNNKKATLILPISIVFFPPSLFIFLNKLSLTQQILTLLLMIFLSADGCLTRLCQMLYIKSHMGFLYSSQALAFTLKEDIPQSSL